MPGSSAVERVAVNHDVGGSSPPPAANKNSSYNKGDFCLLSLFVTMVYTYAT